MIPVPVVAGVVMVALAMGAAVYSALMVSPNETAEPQEGDDDDSEE